MSKQTVEEMLEQLKKDGNAPKWFTIEALKTLQGGYMLKGETPRDMWWRISEASAKNLGKPDLTPKFFNLFWKGWAGAASPILANMGTSRGLPISCYESHVGDSVDDIFMKIHELAMLSKTGGGVGLYFGDVRGRKANIKNNGKSEGIVPWIKVVDSSTVAVNQGGTRKGASAVFVPIRHSDVEEFMKIRRPQGDEKRQCLNTNHGVCIDDAWMQELENGNEEHRQLWKELLLTRFETGQPYIIFLDNANKNLPDGYMKNVDKFPRIFAGEKYYIVTSNICTEIFQYTDYEHTATCCLSSMNLARWEEWKDSDAVYLLTWFLDGVIQEFIKRAPEYPGLENALRSAVKGRAIGVGVMGFHTLLQKKMIPFEGLQSKLLNTQIFKHLDAETRRASMDMAQVYGEPEWCEGTGYRNTHRIAVAPTTTNSTICSANGELLSPSIEPHTANTFKQGTAKGVFIRKNTELEKLLKQKQKNTAEVWKSIVGNDGSVQHLDFLSEEEKAIFLTAREINQFTIIKLAGDRLPYIDQGQSINLFFTANSTPRYMSEVTKLAWKEGLKSLYYLRPEPVLRADSGSRGHERKIEECSWCEG